MLLAAVERAEHPHPANLGDLERHAGGGDLRERTGIGVGGDVRDVEPAEALGDNGVGDLGRDRDDQDGGQQMRLLGEGDRGAVQPGPAVAAAGVGALHRPVEVGRRVRRGAHPIEPGVRRHDDAREVAIVGARLKRGRPPGGEREIDLPQRAQIGETRRRRRLGRERDRKGARVLQHDGPRPCAGPRGRGPAARAG